MQAVRRTAGSHLVPSCHANPLRLHLNGCHEPEIVDEATPWSLGSNKSLARALSSICRPGCKRVSRAQSNAQLRLLLSRWSSHMHLQNQTRTPPLGVVLETGSVKRRRVPAPTQRAACESTTPRTTPCPSSCRTPRRWASRRDSWGNKAASEVPKPQISARTSGARCLGGPMPLEADRTASLVASSKAAGHFPAVIRVCSSDACVVLLVGDQRRLIRLADCAAGGCGTSTGAMAGSWPCSAGNRQGNRHTSPCCGGMGGCVSKRQSLAHASYSAGGSIAMMRGWASAPTPGRIINACRAV